MKVLRIISELDFGGVEQVALNSFPALQQVVELQVLVLKNGGKVSEELINQGLSVKVLNKNTRIPHLNLIRSLQKKIQAFHPDVVHCQGAEANFHGILAASFEKVPRIVAEEIGIPNHHSYWKWIFRWVYAKAHVVIAISEAVKAAIVSLGEVDPNKVKVLYNPVYLGDKARDFSLRSSGRNDQNTSGATFVFVCTCRLVPIKNLERLIQAFAGLVKENQEEELILKIVGDGPERKKLESLSLKLELGNRIEFSGFQQDIWPFLQDADAFILPSLQEGSSVSLAEAMTAGLPSIVTQMGGASELLGDSKSGYLIDPMSSDNIQYTMQQLIDLSPEERHAMGERARKEAKRFTLENYIQSLMSIYTLSDFIPKPSDF
ncbi:glycosyltransferase [Algoriphagus sp.]|uniref:glycosyltransferase n=1 Tax=Algoriphagus sp. TaxID=1872435 RepID=UPI003F6F72D5